MATPSHDIQEKQKLSVDVNSGSNSGSGGGGNDTMLTGEDTVVKVHGDVEKEQEEKKRGSSSGCGD